MSRVALMCLTLSSLARADVSLPRDTAGGDVMCEGRRCVISRALFDRLLSNSNDLATSTRIVPSLTDGRPNGFKLYAIRPHSLFARLMIQNGDTVRSINGFDLSSPDRALELYSKLRNSNHFSVELERRGSSLTFDYEIR